MPEAGTKTATAYIGLGSNLGDRARNLVDALNRLAKRPAVRITGLSSIYEGAAHTRSPRESAPDFLNAVAQIETSYAPPELLRAVRDIERMMGRDPATAGNWAPRTIDLDLLIYNDVRLRTGTLTLPHPRLAARRFVLEPLAEINKDAYVPLPFDRRVAELLAECTDSSTLVRVGKLEMHDADIRTEMF